MTTVHQLIARLQELDSEARQLLANAASDARFDDVSLIAPIARDISDLAARWKEQVSMEPVGEVAEANVSPNRREVSVKQKGTRKKIDGKTNYPQFVREKDDLVKIGWSDREQGPYEHRVAKSSIDQIATALESKGKTGHRFSLADVSQESQMGEIPSYQLYAAVLWLKWNGMLLQHGRQGYTIIKPQTFRSSVENAWRTLSRR